MCFLSLFGGGLCISELIWDFKLIAPIFLIGTLALAPHIKHWDAHPSPHIPKHAFIFGVDLQLCLGILEL